MSRIYSFCALDLVLAIAVSTASTGQPQMDNPEAVTRALEDRWTVERIKDYCRAETLHDPGHQNLVTMGSERWEGKLHPNLRDEIGEVYWYADVRDGKLHAVSVNVSKGDDHWVLETAGAEPLMTQRLSDIEVTARRLDKAIYWAVYLQSRLHPEWGQTNDPVTEDDKTYNRYNDLLREKLSGRRVEFDVDTSQPTKYTRICEGSRATIVVELDSGGNPETFYSDGTEDKFLNHMYEEFRENWSKHLEEATQY